jgi:trans-2-enoyl-CoA reductase
MLTRKMQHQFMCKHKLMTQSSSSLPFYIQLVLKVKQQVALVAGCVIKGSAMFCQKNILGQSMMLHGDYKKRCLLAIMVSQIL